MNKALLLSLMMAASAGFIKFKQSPPPKMGHPFTDEELKKLATLSGKEKKKYLKELHEKYAGQVVELERS
jgi:hypothetical protein